MSSRKYIILGFTLLLFGCKSTHITKKITKSLNDGFYDNQFTGLLVYNPETNDTIFNYNADKYFIPASNTKIITLYTALQVLPEKIPAFKYHVDQDTITIQGTGDPSFLHSYFQDSTALITAKKYEKVYLMLDNLSDKKLGPGWAWDDFDTYYSPERSSFPMYGNVITVYNQDSLHCIPKVLSSRLEPATSKYKRKLNENRFYYNPEKKGTVEIPLMVDSLLISELWNAILPNKVTIINKAPQKMEHTAYGIPTDSLFKRMMHVSDNFLAEQMLILSSSTLSDTLSSQNIRELILENHLKELKQKPRWVDGSGLSRYNLFTPASLVQILTKLYKDIPRERLLNLFPVGGKYGTLKNWYAGNPRPFIYAKSGTLSNNHCLSGYLITDSGKTLIFSFMNNHYTKPITEVKIRMQTIFEWLRDNY